MLLNRGSWVLIPHGVAGATPPTRGGCFTPRSGRVGPSPGLARRPATRAAAEEGGDPLRQLVPDLDVEGNGVEGGEPGGRRRVLDEHVLFQDRGESALLQRGRGFGLVPANGAVRAPNGAIGQAGEAAGD